MKSKTLILTFIIAITSLETVLSQSISFRLKHKNQTEIKFGSGISPNGSLSSTKDTSTAGMQYFSDSYFLPTKIRVIGLTLCWLNRFKVVKIFYFP